MKLKMFTIPMDRAKDGEDIYLSCMYKEDGEFYWRHIVCDGDSLTANGILQRVVACFNERPKAGDSYVEVLGLPNSYLLHHNAKQSDLDVPEHLQRCFKVAASDVPIEGYYHFQEGFIVNWFNSGMPPEVEAESSKHTSADDVIPVGQRRDEYLHVLHNRIICKTCNTCNDWDKERCVSIKSCEWQPIEPVCKTDTCLYYEHENCKDTGDCTTLIEKQQINDHCNTCNGTVHDYNTCPDVDRCVKHAETMAIYKRHSVRNKESLAVDVDVSLKTSIILLLNEKIVNSGYEMRTGEYDGSAYIANGITPQMLVDFVLKFVKSPKVREYWFNEFSEGESE
jgi:hypothetical protein